MAISRLPVQILESLAEQALHVAKKARKHKKNLASDNYYGNRLAALRADAVNAFREMASHSAGDTSALAELIETTFAAETTAPKRLASYRELTFALRTTWKQPAADQAPGGTQAPDEGFFPLAILVQTRRGYLVTIGRQMNGCFNAGWYDACAVMMRRLIEIAIIESFERKQIAQKIKGADGNYLHLTELIGITLNESTLPLSRNAKRHFPDLRDIGHQSAHGRYYFARRGDLEKVQQGCRVVIEELLHHAELL